MIITSFYLGCLAHASYLVGDADSGTAWVIDPQRDIDIYLDEARRLGLRITDVALTHLHADFVAGHLELRDRVGARIHLGAPAKVGYATVPAADGDEHRLGSTIITAWHTPGHTPEGVTWLVRPSPDAPMHAAFTGDTLFIGDVGRPDLLASAGMRADDLAGMLHTSLQRLLTLPDATRVLPAHGAGSLCGRNLSKDRESTIGRERANNYALQPMPRDEFIRRVTADQPPAPAYFAHDVAMNKADRPTAEQPSTALAPEAFAAAVAAGAQLLDVRDAGVFAGGHLPGAIQVGIDGQFAMWAGAVLDPSRPVAVVCEPGREQEAALRLRRIGFDRIAGHLDGGMAALAGDPRITRTQRFEAAALRDALAGSAAPLVVDVRNPSERANGAIPGSIPVPLPELPRRLAELPKDRTIVVHCAGGYRSMVAASLVAASGRTAADLLGGYGAWSGVAGCSTGR